MVVLVHIHVVIPPNTAAKPALLKIITLIKYTILKTPSDTKAHPHIGAPVLILGARVRVPRSALPYSRTLLHLHQTLWTSMQLKLSKRMKASYNVGKV